MEWTRRYSPVKRSWFAWYPVLCTDDKWRWFERVSMVYIGSGGCGEAVFNYEKWTPEMTTKERGDVKTAINFLREQANTFQSVHDIAPLSSLGEHHAACALRAEAERLEGLLT